MRLVAIENPYPGAMLKIRYNPAKTSRAKDRMILHVTYGTPRIGFAEIELVAAFLAAEGGLCANDDS